MSIISDEDKNIILKALIEKAKKYKLSELSKEEAQEDAFGSLTTSIQKAIDKEKTE